MHGEGDPAAAWLGDRQPAERLIWRSQSTSRGSRPTRRRVPPRHVAEVPLHNGVGARIDFPECVQSAHPNRVAATETVAAPNGRPPRASRRTTSASAPGLALGEAAVNGPDCRSSCGPRRSRSRFAIGGRPPVARRPVLPEIVRCGKRGRADLGQAPHSRVLLLRSRSSARRG
jgi:hypothetical protein